MVEVKSISLNKLTAIYKEAMAVLPRLKAQDKEFKNHFGDDNYVDFNVDELERGLKELKNTMIYFLSNKYRTKICPNIAVNDYIPNDLFGPLEFDAVKLIDHLNENILRDLEIISFASILKDSRELFTTPVSSWNKEPGLIKKELDTVVGKSRIKGFSYRNGRNLIGHFTFERIRSFEKLIKLVLDNRQIFTNIAPSQVEGPFRTAEMLGAHDYLPVTVENPNPHLLCVQFNKSGSIDFLFRNHADVLRIVSALAGEQPDIFFPKAEIDVESLFKKDSGRLKRVCKR